MGKLVDNFIERASGAASELKISVDDDSERTTINNEENPEP